MVTNKFKTQTLTDIFLAGQTLKLALFSADPTELGDLTSEFDTTKGYGRVTIIANSTNFELVNDTANNDIYVTNKNNIQFPQPTDALGDVNYVGILDSANDMLMYYAKNGTVNAFANLVVPANGLKFRVRS